MKNKNKNIHFPILGKLTFFWIGLCIQIPWSDVLGALSFYQKKFPQYNISQLVTVPVFFASWLGIFILVKTSFFSIKGKVLFTLGFNAFFLLVIPFQAQYWTGLSGIICFISLNMLSAASSAALQGCLIGLGGIFPKEFITFFSIGTGVSGIASSMLRVFLLLSFKEGIDDLQTAAPWEFKQTIVYFSLSAIVLISGAGIFQTFWSKYFTNKEQIEQQNNIANSQEQHEQIEDPLILSDDPGTTLEESTKDSSELPPSPSSFSFLKIVFKLSIKFQILCLLSMTITFIIYPSLTLAYSITGINSDWSDTLLVLVYNCSDTIAKICTHIFHHPATQKSITYMVLFRIIFLPIFLLSFFYHFKTAFSSPYFQFIMISLFAFTHGFVVTEIFVLTRYSCKNKKQKELAGQILAFMLYFGVSAGSFISMAID